MVKRAFKGQVSKDLDYLNNKPIKIYYRVVAGEDNLHPLQRYDVIFDEADLRIRKLDTEDNLKYIREVQKIV